MSEITLEKPPASQDQTASTTTASELSADAVLTHTDSKSDNVPNQTFDTLPKLEAGKTPGRGRKKETLLAFLARITTELRNSKFALASFVVNNLRRRYRRSVLGFAWSLLNPLFTMAIMTGVFSLLWHSNPKEFGVYVFTGLLPWAFISDSVTMGGQSLVQSEAFLKKVYIPKAFFPLVAVSTELANFVFSLSSLILLAVLLGLQLKATFLLAPLAVALTFIFTFSVSLLVAVTTVYFRDLTHIIRVLLNGMFYSIPVIYKLDMVPEKYKIAFMLNPIFHFVDLFHNLIYSGTWPTAAQWAAPTAISFATCALALVVLRKTEKDLIYRL